jgi:hypothetical protein
VIYNTDTTSDWFRELLARDSLSNTFPVYVVLVISIVVMLVLMLCYYVLLLKANPQVWVMSLRLKVFFVLSYLLSLGGVIVSTFVLSVGIKLAIVCFVCLYCVMLLYFHYKLFSEVL